MFGALATIGLLQALTMLVLMARTKVLALLLGPEWIGVLGVVDRLLAVLAQTAALSLAFAALRFLPAAWSEGPRAFQALALRMRNVLIATAALATIAGLLITWRLPQLWGDALSDYRSIVAVGMLSIPALILVPFVQNAIAGALRHDLSMLFGLAHALTFMAASVAGAWWGGLHGLYLASAAGSLILVCSSLAIGGMRLRRAAGGHEPGLALALPRNVVRFGLALMALAFLAPFAAFYVHYLVLERHGSEVTGWLTAAVGVSYFVRALLGQGHAVFMTPRINRGGEPAERMAWLDDYQRMFTAVGGVAILPVLLFPDLVVSLVFSREFAPGAQFVALFVVAEVMLLIAGPLQGLIVALDHLTFHVAQNLAAQGALVALAAVLVAPYGIAGAGVAALAAPLVLFTGSVAFLRWRYGLLLGRSSLLITAYVGIAAAFAGYVGARYSGLAWEVVLVKAVLWPLLAAPIPVLLRPGDRAMIFAAVEATLAVRHKLGQRRS